MKSSLVSLGVLFASMLADQALAAEHGYDCHGYKSNWGFGKLELVLSIDTTADTVAYTVFENSKEACRAEVELDPTYKPRARKDYVRYLNGRGLEGLGGTLFLEKALPTGGKKLRDGQKGGLAILQEGGDRTYIEHRFVCTERKTRR